MSEFMLYNKRKSRVVYVGQLGIGGKHPIRIQSMVTASTKNTTAIVQEIKDLVAAGCEIIRFTVPTKEDAQNLPNIKAQLKKESIRVPLVADIHFTPSIAMDVVPYVDKVRINPGNFIDKKLFKNHEYNDASYQLELERIREKFTPLVLKCKEYGVALRIGTNHGSLSDRILSRYGDTAEGMVESALEFILVADSLDFNDIILSMKASNTRVMINAYRLLAQKLDAQGLNYPFHLGVTEAGDAEDGRIKSAVGIGTLLEEGIGDTIRVSLTEDAVYEIPVAKALVAPYDLKGSVATHASHINESTSAHTPELSTSRYQAAYKRRQTTQCNLKVFAFGHTEPARVWTRMASNDLKDVVHYLKTHNDSGFEGLEFTPNNFSPEIAKQAASLNLATAVLTGNPTELRQHMQANKWVLVIKQKSTLCELDQLIKNSLDHNTHLEICLDETLVRTPDFDTTLKHICTLVAENGLVNFSLSLNTADPCAHYRILLNKLTELKLNCPLHLRYTTTTIFPAITHASTHLGSLLVDGLGDSVQIDSPLPLKDNLQLCYGILQACRVRMTKTEYIACPSCGRTLFDLQQVTAKIKAATSHLKGVKIGIMGCIVNGPGEMADADFGYVGTGTSKISLYVGQNCIERNIPENQALEKLISLIKENGKWVEPTPSRH